MKDSYFSSRAIEITEMVEVFKSWGLKQGEAITLAILLLFPHALNHDEVINLIDSFPVNGDRCGPLPVFKEP